MSDARPIYGTFWVSSLFGARTRQPLVSITFRAESVDVTPADARALAYNLLECAAAAEYDAIVFTVCHDAFDLDDVQAAKLMNLFRDARNTSAAREEEP